MIIQTAITSEMLDELKTSGVIMPKTNFNTHPQAYSILSEITEYDNFFFGVVLNEAINEDTQNVAGITGYDNEIYLKLDVPDDLVFYHNFYDFSDLIYFTEEEPDEDVIRKLKRLLSQNAASQNDLNQAVYPYIKLEWIHSISEKPF